MATNGDLKFDGEQPRRMAQQFLDALEEEPDEVRLSLTSSPERGEAEAETEEQEDDLDGWEREEYDGHVPTTAQARVLQALIETNPPTASRDVNAHTQHHASPALSQLYDEGLVARKGLYHEGAERKLNHYKPTPAVEELFQ